jgi:EAL domain-containing protein (putative c-di-GMP-specific phosphodiesterase class I)
MGKLKELGVSFSIDDFGTGYSSLSMLQRFPLSTLKIDKTFVSEVPGNCHAKSIIEAIIAMARSMRFSTIAEGVENSEQLEYLRSVGCDNYQGFYMSKAVDAAAATALLRSFSLEIA